MAIKNRNYEFHLTDEQRQFVAENHNLIYSFLRKYNLLADDDNYSVAAIGLCKAACRYTPDRGAYSSFAYCCMESEFGHQHTIANSEKRRADKYTECYDFSSYDREESSARSWQEYQQNIKAMEIINQASRYNVFENDEIQNIMYRSFIGTLEDRQREIVSLYEQGYGSSEIAANLGCVPSNITYFRKQIKNKYMEFAGA